MNYSPSHPRCESCGVIHRIDQIVQYPDGRWLHAECREKEWEARLAVRRTDWVVSYQARDDAGGGVAAVFSTEELAKESVARYENPDLEGYDEWLIYSYHPHLVDYDWGATRKAVDHED